MRTCGTSARGCRDPHDTWGELVECFMRPVAGAPFETRRRRLEGVRARAPRAADKPAILDLGGTNGRSPAPARFRSSSSGRPSERGAFEPRQTIVKRPAPRRPVVEAPSSKPVPSNTATTVDPWEAVGPPVNADQGVRWTLRALGPVGFWTSSKVTGVPRRGCGNHGRGWP